jgi:hypothetical protein
MISFNWFAIVLLPFVLHETQKTGISGLKSHFRFAKLSICLSILPPLRCLYSRYYLFRLSPISPRAQARAGKPFTFISSNCLRSDGHKQRSGGQASPLDLKSRAQWLKMMPPLCTRLVNRP